MSSANFIKFATLVAASFGALAKQGEAVKDGKVQAIVVPYDFTGIVNVPAPRN